MPPFPRRLLCAMMGERRWKRRGAGCEPCESSRSSPPLYFDLRLTCLGALFQFSQHADRGDAGEKEVGAAAHFYEARDAGVALAHGLALDSECAG
jgi:hypothetical protein